MASVELLLSPLPAHVRTARLVGVAAARRAGLDDDDVADLRLALGEACARAVALHAQHAPDTQVRIVVRDDPSGLVVEVTDCGPPAGPVRTDVSDWLTSDGDAGQDGETPDPELALVVLAGLVDSLTVLPEPTGTTLRMTWPLAARDLTGGRSAGSVRRADVSDLTPVDSGPV